MTDTEESLESRLPTCPLCHTADHVRRLLFFTYCANPEHSHKKGETPRNTIMEFRYCIVHGQPDRCVKTILEQGDGSG